MSDETDEISYPAAAGYLSGTAEHIARELERAVRMPAKAMRKRVLVLASDLAKAPAAAEASGRRETQRIKALAKEGR